jgi:2-polyprenyl-3-methyl-5-hydroxy-6-metoxy-1,4-benzoquinol methylase
MDKTYLSLDNAEKRGFIHRDYIAHCLRWSHVIKRLGEKQAYKTAHILDIGCGKEIPLAKMLYSSKMSPASYTGVDAGKIELPDFFDKIEAKIETHLYPQSDFNFLTDQQMFHLPFTHITCFEVLEHMEKVQGLRLLNNIAKYTGRNTLVFLSTPCYNGSQANNHVYEWQYGELKEELLKRFKIRGHWGTFASIKDYEQVLGYFGISAEAFNKLRDYYDTNYLATIFAPLVPGKARNVLWELIRV